MVTREWDSDLQDYIECCDCKFDFGSGYAGDIIPYIEKYRDKIDKYKREENDNEIHDTIEWRNRFQ